MSSSNWGGKREGAGRKKSIVERKGRTFRLTDTELLAVKPIIDAIRRRTEMAAAIQAKSKSKVKKVK